MNLKRLRCLLVIISFSAFSMPVFAAPVVPGQIDSFDDINDTNWVEAAGGWNGTYMEQALVGAPNEVKEGTGSMKIDFTQYSAPGKRDETFRTFDPGLDLSNYENLAITLWVWIKDPNDSRRETHDSRLTDIVLTDSNFVEYDAATSPFPYYEGPLGKFTVQGFKNVGWNKVVAPLRNFRWTIDNAGIEGSDIEPNEVLWNDITQIGLFADTNTVGDNNAIYIDDMRFELAPNQPARPYQVASCDNIWDELWDELRASGTMFQTPPGDSNFTEGTGSMMIDFTLFGDSRPDICPSFTFIPALDFTDGNDWAITMWVWSDLAGDSELWQMILHDVAGNLGRYRVPLPATYGWNKVTANIDEFLWQPAWDGRDIPVMSADEACLDAILFLELWTHTWPVDGNAIYLDDLRIETPVEALSEAIVYNADYAPPGTITVDGNTPDWAGLVDSDIIDMNLTALPNQPRGELHVKYRLAWDPNYLYILVEELPGDQDPCEAVSHAAFTASGKDSMYDSLTLWFDFTNNRLAGIKLHISFWLSLGLSSTEQTDLIAAWINATWPDVPPYHNHAPVANASVATGGTLGSRVIEARVKWSDLDDSLDSWWLPDPNLGAAVQPGYIFGCDPRLNDRENLASRVWTAEHGAGWFTGWMWDDYTLKTFCPTGRDTYSTDIRLVCSAGDLDFDCDVDFVDYSQFAAEWDETDCNSLNDFCDGADIVTPMDGDVDLEDLGRFALRWLLP